MTQPLVSEFALELDPSKNSTIPFGGFDLWDSVAGFVASPRLNNTTFSLRLTGKARGCSTNEPPQSRCAEIRGAQERAKCQLARARSAT